VRNKTFFFQKLYFFEKVFNFDSKTENCNFINFRITSTDHRKHLPKTSRKIISPEKWFKDVINRGLVTFLITSMDYFLRIHFTITSWITFIDYFHGYLVDSRVDKKKEEKGLEIKLFFFNYIFLKKFQFRLENRKL
jgi:hypothetical protein